MKTLREKFTKYVYCYSGSGMLTNTYDDGVIDLCSKSCEQIADDYAIEFAEWLVNSSYFFNIGMKEMTFEQVLEIFKKEKGL